MLPQSPPARDRDSPLRPSHFFLICLLFFGSGSSGLVYQVVWVRVFGNVFGNTIHSASLIVAVFMLGLGLGSYLVGVWADRRYAVRPESLLLAYAYVELAIGGVGLVVSLLLPHLGGLSALASSYSLGASGWYELSATSHVARAGIAVILLLPVTVLMGGTLTLLIRHVTRRDLSVAGWRIALLYGVNTVGAALGCFLTDFVIVPNVGIQQAQVAAVGVNVLAGLGALGLAGATRGPNGKARQGSRSQRAKAVAEQSGPGRLDRARVGLTVAALAVSGFAGMSMEIVWFRHFTMLLGGFRAVFSLLLTILLLGIGVGSIAGGALSRRTVRPAAWFMGAQGLFAASLLLGLAGASARPIEAALALDPTQGAVGFAGTLTRVPSGFARSWAELWFNLVPMLWEVAVPALLMGFSFPLANTIVQRVEHLVGRRAGALYLANTAGAVGGSLVAGFLLLPALGIQLSATVIATIAALAVILLYLAHRESRAACGVSALAAAVALGLWLSLPADYVNRRTLPQVSPPERLLALTDGLTEVVSVTESSDQGRRLLTNGHPMSSTLSYAQRYMRALAHIPLLSMEQPESALIIGFGVGNTTHAVSLHRSIRRVEVAELSGGVLRHAHYFSDANRDVLADPRVRVYVNDGRQHLQMQPSASYDLVTLEPPPIAYAGVAALYSKEFYELARQKLAPGGHLSQWLPAYQVPTRTTLAMIRSFIDVFPRAVLLSGAASDLILIGVNGDRLEIDPDRVSAALSAAPAVQEDLARVDLGSVREIVGSFLASGETLREATRDSSAVIDDRPLQEYDVRSLMNLGEAVPASVIDLAQVGSWCPRCFDASETATVEGLDLYLRLVALAYRALPGEIRPVRETAGSRERVVVGSAYLGSILPETAELHDLLGIEHASRGAFAQAIDEFQRSISLDPSSAEGHWHLGSALASTGNYDRAIEHLRRSVELDPTNELARQDLVTVLRVAGQGR